LNAHTKRKIHMKTSKTRSTTYRLGVLIICLGLALGAGGTALARPEAAPDAPGVFIRYVATYGTDSGNCTNQATPCQTIGYAIGVSVTTPGIAISTPMKRSSTARAAPVILATGMAQAVWASPM
jgi:hypothetical protein